MPTWLPTISGSGSRNFLENSFIGRHKFQHFSKWIREPLGGYVTDVLRQGASNLAELFDWREVETMVHEHVAGRRNYTNELDQLLTISLASHTLFKAVDKCDNK